MKLDRLASWTLVDRYLRLLEERGTDLRDGALAAQLETDQVGTLLGLRSLLLFAPARAEVFDVVRGMPVLRQPAVGEWDELLSDWPTPMPTR